MRLVLLFLLCLDLTIVKAQDSTLVANQTSKEDSLKLTDNQLKSGETYAIDTIIDGRSVFNRIEAIKPIVDKELDDDEYAANIDQKWLDELYSSSLYDTIYKSVSELKYEEIDYPELSTDTLKSRLKRLNSKTPFNVEYNPSLESVIKSYLKNRRQSLERLMALSEYYFPTFERASIDQLRSDVLVDRAKADLFLAFLGDGKSGGCKMDITKRGQGQYIVEIRRHYNA